MISLEKLPDGRIRLNAFMGSGWYREEFPNTDELYIYAHKNGICLNDCDIINEKGREAV
jgi:hypothetical protein